MSSRDGERCAAAPPRAGGDRAQVETIEDARRRIRDLEVRVAGLQAELADARNAALQGNESRYRALFESLNEGFALNDLLFDREGRPCDWRFLTVNAAFERMTGLAKERVVGHTVREVLPGIEPLWFEKCGEVVRTGLPAIFQSRAADLGREYEVSAFRTETNQFACLLVDVTDRRQAEEALRRAVSEAEESKRVLEAMMDSIPEGITITGGPPDFPIVKVSRAGWELAGGQKPSMTGMASGQHQRTWHIFHTDGVTTPKPEEMPLYRASSASPARCLSSACGSSAHDACHTCPLTPSGSNECW